jgi:hypothetical protein
MTKRWLALAVFMLGCDGDGDGGGGGGDRVREVCSRAMTAVCATMVRCHAVAGSVPFTNALCEQLLPDLVDNCVAESASTIGSASDAMVSACVNGYGELACTALCNQIPQDPPACQALGSPPNESYITCE